ncbi:MAG: hypothetical protein GX640_07705 [Fibrobacter sp.]|nr:hypothetical protein [Fibrobacter sp.]
MKTKKIFFKSEMFSDSGIKKRQTVTFFHRCIQIEKLSVVLVVIGILALSGSAFAFNVPVFFPKNETRFDVSSQDFQNYLYFNAQDNKLYTRGNFGLEFPLISYSPKAPMVYTLEVAASAHIVMIPVSTKFPVDNFYASLAIFFTGQQTSYFNWRFYPLYHVSAHLADGYPGDILRSNVHAISSEMIKFEGIFTPVNGLEISASAGWYYHTCYQKNLKVRLEADLLYNFNINNWLRPYISIQNELIKHQQWHPGTDISTGLLFGKKETRGLGIALRYFNRLNPGYYFENRENGIGIQLNFIL